MLFLSSDDSKLVLFNSRICINAQTRILLQLTKGRDRMRIMSRLSQLCIFFATVSAVANSPGAASVPNATAAVIAHVAAHMNESFREPAGILTYPYLVPSGPYDTLWDWDSLFMGVGGLSFGSQPYFTGTFMNFLSHVNLSTGELPGGLSPAGNPGVLYHAKPVILQGAWLAAKASGDSASWKQFQPAMEALLSYWAGTMPGGSSARRVDAVTGLPLWHDQLETGCDNLVFSECPSQFSDCWDEARDAFTLSSPDLVVFLAREHAAYANFVRAWGGAGAAPRAELAAAEGRRLGDLLSTYMFDGAGGYFGAYNVSSRAQVPSRTFQMAWPLWAGMANASQAATALAAVLAPDMRGPFGVRSVSAADARYSEENIITPYSNWRGPIWVNANAVLAYTLARHGRAADAAALADDIVAVLAADLQAGAGWHECYNGDTGAALAAPGFLSWDVLGASLQADVAAGRDPFALD